MQNKLCGRIGQLLCVHSKELVGTELWVGSRDSNHDVPANGCWRVSERGQVSGIKGNQFESTGSVMGMANMDIKKWWWQARI